MDLQNFCFNSLWVLGIAVIWLFIVVIVCAAINTTRDNRKK